MKQLCEVLKPISNTAKQITVNPAEPKSLLTNEDSKQITETTNALIQQMPDKIKMLVSLRNAMRLTGFVKISEIRSSSDKYGVEYLPTKANFGEITEDQRQRGLYFIEQMTRPMSEDGLKQLYLRLKLTTSKYNESPENEALRQAIYVEEMRKYPANIVREVMKMSFKNFPTLAELKELCEMDYRIYRVLKKGLER